MSEAEQKVLAALKKLKVDRVEMGRTEVRSTGIYLIDHLTDIGGLPRGKLIEVYGQPSAGKSTLVAQIIANMQRIHNISALYVDFELIMDKDYMVQLGVNPDKCELLRPETLEDGFEAAFAYLDHMGVQLLLVDTLAAAIPTSVLDKTMLDKVKIGSLSTQVAEAMKRLMGRLYKTGCICIFVNQVRTKISTTGKAQNITPGGNSVQFYSCQRFELLKREKIEGGMKVTIRNTKNKMGKPFMELDGVIKYGEGFKDGYTLLRIACEQGVVEQRGSCFVLQGHSFKGRDAFVEMLEEKPKVKKHIIDNLKW